MTWTYSGNPLASTKDAVRFELQDTVASRPLMQDEEIDYYLSLYGQLYTGVTMVAAELADLLAGRFASEVSISGDGVTASFDQLQDKYTKLAVSLRERYARTQGVGVAPYVGGIDRFEAPDYTLKPRDFTIGMHDNPEAGDQSVPDATADSVFPDPSCP